VGIAKEGMAIPFDRLRNRHAANDLCDVIGNLGPTGECGAPPVASRLPLAFTAPAPKCGAKKLLAYSFWGILADMMF
jgi:hypothetical protein